MKNPTKTRTKWIFAVAVAGASLVLALTPAHAQMTTIVEHSFDGTGSALNGVDVVTEGGTFDAGITSAGGSGTWAAGAAFLDNGTVTVGSAQTGAYLNLGSYINDAKGTAAGQFDLTMTISETVGEWISLGFSTLNAPATGNDFTQAAQSGLGTIIYRNTGELDMFIGPQTGGTISGLSLSQIPEPSAGALLGFGGLALLLRRRR